ncbi:hypothetical protein A2U01_0017940, partial [Trifolium medium]|nr:hypothetical protein [Trifolium medium]
MSKLRMAENSSLFKFRYAIA